eukprot:CAMPEP_0201591932 /NCGR_PEP_ID=MMETSP0190_2-20130828/189967_1 /ASSEMBLY_ACC=CAM_ASM_000263 /TAXON_ID=37353 /ORGANISM="Rosalina sp." /LENGTH=348 /DNA_ID=CAMNT_0048050473 /DNA_START=59 /DNA_END=1105 /DNA_ORIENTATION=+
MLTLILSLILSVSTITNAGGPLPFNPNLQLNDTDPINSLQTKFEYEQAKTNILSASLNKPPHAIPIESDKELTRKLALKYAIRIHKKPLNIWNITEIKDIWDTSKFTSTYAGSLPTIISLSYSRIDMFNPKSLRHAQIGIRNFKIFMDLLHIKPMTVTELDNPDFLDLHSILQLLILSSRAIVHSYAFTDIFDQPKQANYQAVNTPSTELYPWLNPKHIDTDCTLDVWKIIYWHSYDYLSARNEEIGINLPALDSLWDYERDGHTFVTELINKFGFIPWRRDTVEKMSKVRDSDEFAECYAMATSQVWQDFFDPDEIGEFGEAFFGEFDIGKDYEKVMEKSCDSVCHD